VTAEGGTKTGNAPPSENGIPHNKLAEKLRQYTALHSSKCPTFLGDNITVNNMHPPNSKKYLPLDFFLV
jgi:hypothetical protein